MNIAELFESLKFDDINDFVSSRQEENLYLDFKTINNANLKNNDDKRNLSKALSGFANSNGGLIVWGVDARKNSQDIDCATEIRMVEDVDLLISRLNEFTGMAVSPIVDGVQHRAIKLKENKGVVITYIPESQSGPHMAKMREDRYYKRSGDSFYRLEHFDLEDMFGRRPKPKLELYTRIKGVGLEVNIIVGIRNDGRGSAKAPYLAFSVSSPYRRSEYGLDGNRNEGMKRLPYLGSELQHRYGEGLNVVIHPGVAHEIACITLGLTPDPKSKPETNLVIEYEMAADGFMLSRGIKEISLDDLGIS